MARFDIGNKAAEKWTEDNVYEVFMRMRDIAENDDDVLCLQDLIKHPEVKLYTSGLNYLLEKFPVFEKYKKDLQGIIIARVNAGAIKGDFSGTPAIFRMKQLGEEDKQVHEVTQTNIINLGEGEPEE